MKKQLEVAKAFIIGIGQKAKVRKGMLSVVAIFFVLQMYFVRELLAAELLFGLGFAMLLMLGVLFYLVGAVGERGLDWAEAGVRVISISARRGYAGLDEITRKSFRHPRSESAQ
ncbi:MAG: hypothetical protein WA211_05035 [Candidatus Acidiferrales bacterium]|jgi:hypothetical protein